MLARLALGNVRKSLADFGIYFLTVMLGVAVFYAFNSMTAQQGVLAFSETQSKMFDLLGMVIGGVSVFIAFVLVFLVVYANSFLIKRRKREFGVYLALGMSTGDVVKIVALESLIAGAASLAAGLVVGIGLSQLLLQLTSALFQADVAEAGVRVLGRRVGEDRHRVRGHLPDGRAVERAHGGAGEAYRPSARAA